MRAATVWKVSGAAFALAVLLVVYTYFDPEKTSWMPKCLFKTLTGWDCPGCGSQRMVHALLSGDLVRAWNANPFLLLLLPFVGFIVWLETQRTRRPRLYARFYRPVLFYAVLLALVVWTVARNLL